MIQAQLHQLLSDIPGAELHGDAAFVGLSTDSRQVAPGNLFVALRGEHFDAHQFLEQVQAAGAAAVVRSGNAAAVGATQGLPPPQDPFRTGGR